MAEPGEGFGFGEFARRHGDFALAGVAVRVRSRDGRLTRGSTCFGVSDVPVTVDVSAQLRAALRDRRRHRPGLTLLRPALSTPRACRRARSSTPAATATRAGYRRRLIAVLAARELSRAYSSASPTESEKGPR